MKSGDATEYDLDDIFPNLVASDIQKWRMFKFLTWVQRSKKKSKAVPLHAMEALWGEEV
jgi:hypothetical protein